MHAKKNFLRLIWFNIFFAFEKLECPRSFFNVVSPYLKFELLDDFFIKSLIDSK